MTFRRFAFVASLPLLVVSPFSWGASLAELEQTVEEQAKEIRDLKRDQRGSRTTLRSLRDQVTASSRRLKIHGFASAGIAASDSEIKDNNDINEDFDTQEDAIVGIQMNFAANDKTDFIVQLLGKGDTEFDIEANWAYARYRSSDKFTWRAGRLNLPFFMLSDFREVGFAYPWVRPPEEVYGHVFFDSYEGFDFIYTDSFGNFDVDFQLLGGRVEDSSDVAKLRNSRLGGLNMNLATGAFRMRLGHIVGRLNDDPNDTSNRPLNQLDRALEAVGGEGWRILQEDTEASFSSIGFQYDNGDLLVLSEFTRLKADGLFGDQDSAYLTVGYRLGRWVPFVSWSKTETIDQDERDDKKAEFENELTDGFDLSDDTFTPDEQNILLNIAELAVQDGDLPAATLTDLRKNLALLNGNPVPNAMVAELLESVSPLLQQADAVIESVPRGIDQVGPEQTTYSLGVRYNLRPGISIKLQADHSTDFSDNGGFYQLDPTSAESLAASKEELGDSVNTLTFVIDTVF